MRAPKPLQLPCNPADQQPRVESAQVDGIADQRQVRLAIANIETNPVPLAIGAPWEFERLRGGSNVRVLEQGCAPAIENDLHLSARYTAYCSLETDTGIP